jgi:hypothetical protein
VTVPHSGKGWRLAPALIALEAEADRIAPRRRRTSDGSIGDQAHAARKSNHNPDGGYVDAFDLSHDPANGMDAHAHVRAWVARLDPRLEEVISNKRIWTYDRRSEGWRAYKGENGHTLHAHITVKNSHRFDTSPWFSGVPAFPTKPVPPPVPPPATGPTAADLLFIQQLIEDEETDMVVIRNGKGIAHLVNNRTIGLNAVQLVALRKAYKAANKPLPELTLDTDSLWRWYTGLD